MQSIRWKIAQAFEIRWWRQYLKSKTKTEYLAWKRQYWLDFLKKCELNPSKDATVLDAGCGPAGIFMLFDSPKTTVALDPLLDRYEQDLEHFRRADYPNIDFVASPLELWTPPQTFDYVFCLNAINHVADLERCFDLLLAATKPDATLVVSIDAHNYQAFKHIFRLAPGDILHPHQYDLAEYEAMLTSRGCRIENTICMKKEFFFDYYVLVARKNVG